MQEAVPPAPSERGWGKLLLALAAFLFVPHLPYVRDMLPVEDTLLLVVPSLAACALVGWWAGSRPFLALLSVAVAGIIIGQPAVPGSFYNLVRGWSLLLGGGFGLVCLLGSHRPFFSRAIATLSLAMVVVLVLASRGPLTPTRTQEAVHKEYLRRNDETLGVMRMAATENPQMAKSLAKYSEAPDTLAARFGTLANAGVVVFPSMLLLESLVALGLAWATFHRLSRTRLGPPLGRLKDFRFNDQLVWGLIAGIAIVFLPSLDFLSGVGYNLLVFFGALYAIRGFGVASWFFSPGALASTLLVGLALFFWPVFALAALGLGLGDTWADWRRRTRPTT